MIGLLGLLTLAWPRPGLRLAPVLGLLAYAVLFVVMMTLGGKKFDRYMLPVIPSLDLLAGVGLWAAAGLLLRRRTALGALIGAIGIQAALLWQAYPYPLAAYNPLFGGIAGAREHIVVGWGEGLEQAAAYLNNLPLGQRGNTMTLYQHVLRPRLRYATIRLEESALGESSEEEAAVGDAAAVDPSNVDFFILYVNMAQRDLVPPLAREAVETRVPELVVYVHGAEYARVYRLPPTR